MNSLDELLGTVATLIIIRETPNGMYLAAMPDAPREEQVLLPKNETKKGMKAGDRLEAFIYKDSEDRFIATMHCPPCQVGEIALLTVKEVTAIGAFLDWGLLKDLLLPFKEQTHRVTTGETVLIALYVDKSSRLCGTMHVYDYLYEDSDYSVDDHVTGLVYEITESFGTFVAVDNQYSALIPHNEMTRPLHVGETISARVKEVREDGKLTLSLTEKIPQQMDSDAQTIYTKLTNAGGYLPYHDKSSSEDIKREFYMSKNAFKRAIGRLYKSKKIVIEPDGIRLS